MFGFGTKDKPKLTQAAAFEDFKAALNDAIYAAQKYGVWNATLAQHLEAHANVLDASRPWR